MKLARIPAGRWSKIIVAVLWLIVVAFAGGFAQKLTDVQENDTKNWLPTNAESTKALEIQESFYSQNLAPAVIVYERLSGITEADLAKVAADVQRYKTYEKVDGEVVGPIPAEDRKAIQVIVPIDLGTNGWEQAPGYVDDLLAIANDGASGMSVHLTGPLGFAADSAEAFAGIDSTLLFTALIVVVILLLITYRSPALWILPVVSAVVALTVAQAVIYFLAKYADLTVNAQSAGILTVLVFGAGTDYALLLVARYREELRKHADRHEAMAVAMHRAGPAIIASGLTVIVGMLCLMAAQMNSTKSLGPVTAIGIAVGLLVMVTLLPALLVLCGRWVFWPLRPAFGSPEPTERGVWARVGGFVSGRPRVVWLVTTLVLGAMALGLFDLSAKGLTFEQGFPDKPKSIIGQEAVARHYSAGSGQPVVVVGKEGATQELRDAFQATEGIAPGSVTEPTAKNGWVYLEGTLTAAADSDAAYDTIDRVRDRVHQVDGAEAKVGGFTAVNLDAQRTARRDNKVIIPIVLIVVLLILGVLLRAVLAPLLLIATVVLSFAAALGISALVFDYGFGFEGADSAFPLFVFVFLVALGIDYNIFLMTRVREESIRLGTRRGVLVGLAATGAVITSAGLVLAGTFGALATLPMVFLIEMGFAVAFGVVLDTFIVRSILVPALALDIGKAIWWPSRLSREEPPAESVAEAPAEAQARS